MDDRLSVRFTEMANIRVDDTTHKKRRNGRPDYRLDYYCPCYLNPLNSVEMGSEGVGWA